MLYLCCEYMIVKIVLNYSAKVVGSAIADHAGRLLPLFHAVVRNSGPYQRANFQ